MRIRSSTSSYLSTVLQIGVLVGATLIVYFQVAAFDFINLDDAYYVYKNNNVRTGLTPGNLIWSLTATDVGLWQPLVWISYQIESTFFGPENPQVRHLVNLMLHGCNTVLVFFLVWRISGERFIGLAVALLFALHPQHVQSVAWIAQRKDVLSAFFFLACLLAYIRPLQSVTGNPAYLWWHSAALMFFLMALMSKPSVVPLPILLLLIDYWYAKRNNTFADARVTKWLVNKIPFILTAVAAAWITIQLKHPGFSNAGFLQTGNLALALSSLLHYLKTFFIPWPLPALVETPTQLIWVGVVAIVSLVIPVLFAFVNRKKQPLIGFGLLWFFVMWLPVSGLVPLGQFYVADRYTYLPHIGAFMALIGALYLLPAGLKRATQGLVIMAVSACGVLSAIQVSYWRDAVTLFEREVDIDSANQWGYLYAGEALLARGQTKKALDYFDRALAIDNANSLAHEYRGNALWKLGENDEAYQAFRLAIRNNPRRGNAYVSLAQILSDQGDTQLAVAILNDALKRFPHDNGILNQLGYLHGFFMHDDELALDYYSRVLNNNPKDSHALHASGMLLLSVEEYKKGLKLLEKLLTIEPDNETVRTTVNRHTAQVR